VTDPTPVTDPAQLTHLPKVSTWNCDSCLMTWPCPTARAELLAEHGGPDNPALAAYLHLCLSQAIEDLPGPTVTALYQRFVYWIHTHETTRGQQPG
jgi:hypothetical protein